MTAGSHRKFVLDEFRGVQGPAGWSILSTWLIKAKIAQETRGRRFFCLLQSSRALDCAKIPPSLMQFRQLRHKNEHFFVFVGACVGVGRPNPQTPCIHKHPQLSCFVCDIASVA